MYPNCLHGAPVVKLQYFMQTTHSDFVFFYYTRGNIYYFVVVCDNALITHQFVSLYKLNKKEEMRTCISDFFVFIVFNITNNNKL